MKEQRLIHKGKYKTKSTKGMTMAELLIVIAILGILSAVGIISVQSYQRSLGQIERDGIAKQLFVAAQNHLTMAKGEGYLGIGTSGTNSKYGHTGTYSNGPDDAKSDEKLGVYYYVVNQGTVDPSAAKDMFDQMLPFGAIDETVRSGGSYLIRYQPEAAQVLDVFYCSPEGTQFGYKLKNTDYGNGEKGLLKDYRGEEKKGARRNYTDGSILGWYGGPEAEELLSSDMTLKAPTIEVTNKEKLVVIVGDTNTDKAQSSMKLIVLGESSGAQKSFVLKKSAASSEIPETQRLTKGTMSSDPYEVVLDDITNQTLHFGKIAPDNSEGRKFIPGENLKIQAVAYSLEVLANIAYSGEVIANSLFADIKDSDGGNVPDTAYISNFRHLENLDRKISNLDGNDVGYNEIENENNKLNITSAIQTKDLNWRTDDKTNESDEDGFWYKNTVTAFTTAGATDGAFPVGHYMPIEPDYPFTYNGQKHNISDVRVKNVQNAGLIGSSDKVVEITDLELIGFDIIGKSTGGALAGTLTSNDAMRISNVLVRNSSNGSDVNITAPTAGGLIGSISGGSIEKCGAAVIIGSRTEDDVPTVAGGLIGSATGGTVTQCYSGGHTTDGSYEKWVNASGHYDVTGTTAGGLIGESSATINNSYSTCSVSGTDATGGFVGGFVGSASANIAGCYSTGFVKTKLIPLTATPNSRSENAGIGAFAGTKTEGTTISNCLYYGIISEVKMGAPESATKLGHYLGAVGDKEEDPAGISQIDVNATSYDRFVGAQGNWAASSAYDSTIIKYYGGNYTLRTVFQLPLGGASKATNPDDAKNYFVSTHYGDWPAPELFVMNTASS